MAGRATYAVRKPMNDHDDTTWAHQDELEQQERDSNEMIHQDSKAYLEFLLNCTAQDLKNIK